MKGESIPPPYYMASLASIRAQVEERLSGRVTAPFTARVPTQQPVLSTGIPAIDAIMGGVPCGEITEIVAPRHWRVLSQRRGDFFTSISFGDDFHGFAATVSTQVFCSADGRKNMEAS